MGGAERIANVAKNEVEKSKPGISSMPRGRRIAARGSHFGQEGRSKWRLERHMKPRPADLARRITFSALFLAMVAIFLGLHPKVHATAVGRRSAHGRKSRSISPVRPTNRAAILAA